VLLTPRDPDIIVRREIWVPSPVRSILRGNVPGTGFRDAVADDLINRFVAAYYLTVSLLGNGSKKPDLERLKNHPEVWVLCFRKPRQEQWRLLGQFHAKDRFVGLGLYPRVDLAGVKYAQRAYDTILDWERRFPGEAPCTGSKLSDFLSGNPRDVDKPWF
jgi:hypothetical protein